MNGNQNFDSKKTLERAQVSSKEPDSSKNIDGNNSTKSTSRMFLGVSKVMKMQSVMKDITPLK